MPYGRFQTIRVARDRGVVFATIANPPMNLTDSRMLDDLDRLGRAVESDGDARVLVFESADRGFFIPHIDLSVVKADEAKAAKRPERSETLGYVHLIVERFRTMPKATIGKLEGIARGFGSELLLSLDMRFAALGKALLGQPEVAFGISPGGSSTQRLPRLVGRSRALEILLSGADYPADLAERYGYINRALPPEELGPFVEALAYRIASFSSAAIAAAKRAVEAAEPPVLQGLIEEEYNLYQSVVTPRAEHGMTASFDFGMQDRETELHDFQGIIDRVANDARRRGI